MLTNPLDFGLRLPSFLNCSGVRSFFAPPALSRVLSCREHMRGFVGLKLPDQYSAKCRLLRRYDPAGIREYRGVCRQNTAGRSARPRWIFCQSQRKKRFANRERGREGDIWHNSVTVKANPLCVVVDVGHRNCGAGGACLKARDVSNLSIS